MKTLVKFVSIIVLAGMFVACNSKKENTEELASDEWLEMDAFHMTMAEAFHPFKDSANLEPAKRLAGELATSAEKWMNSPLPENVNNDDVKSKLQALKDSTASFSQLVASGDSIQVGDALTRLHDQFHELQEVFYGGHEHEHGEHKH
jgi:hypothetical protein